MIRFRHAILGIFAVLFVHALAIGFGVYPIFPWFDVPMHFFGGYVIAILGIALFSWLLQFVEIRTKQAGTSKMYVMLLEGIFVIGFVMIIGVAWEWYEFLFDQFAVRFLNVAELAQVSLADTMHDLFNDTVGAIAAWLLWRNKA